MPKGTKVDSVYQALRREGHSEESAAKIAQSETGEALQTGKPPKHRKSLAPNKMKCSSLKRLKGECHCLNCSGVSNVGNR